MLLPLGSSANFWQWDFSFDVVPVDLQKKIIYFYYSFISYCDMEPYIDCTAERYSIITIVHSPVSILAVSPARLHFWTRICSHVRRRSHREISSQLLSVLLSQALCLSGTKSAHCTRACSTQVSNLIPHFWCSWTNNFWGWNLTPDTDGKCLLLSSWFIYLIRIIFEVLLEILLPRNKNSINSTRRISIVHYNDQKILFSIM